MPLRHFLSESSHASQTLAPLALIAFSRPRHEYFRQLYVQLQEMYRELSGNASFTSGESDFEFHLEMTRLGLILIHGHFQELSSEENILHFAFESDQSYVDSTLKSLKAIADHYGDMKGIRERD